MAISSVRTTGQLATVEQLTVAVTNDTGHARAARLHRRGRHHHDGLLAAGQRARGARAASAASLTIEAPSYFAMPSITDGFQVLAFCHSPASVSRTRAYVASLWRVVLQPATVNDPVAGGQLVTVQAEIVNRLDRPMQVARVPGLPRPGHLRAAGHPVQRGHHQPGPAGPDPGRGAHQRQRRGHLQDPLAGRAAPTPSTSRPTSSSRPRPTRTATPRSSL